MTTADPSATTSTSTATVTTLYAYDSQNRLCGVLENVQSSVELASPDPCATSVSGTTTENVWTRYTFDGAGNLASMINGKGKTTHYRYDATGRMTAISEPIDNSDPDSSAVEAVTTTWVYNALGQRVSQSQRGHPSQTLITWTYDAAGRMATRVAGGDTTGYVYDDNGNRTSATDSSGIITITYDRLNRPLSVSSSTDPEPPRPTRTT